MEWLQEGDQLGWRELRTGSLSVISLLPDQYLAVEVVCTGDDTVAIPKKKKKEFQVKFFYQRASFRQKLPIRLLFLCAAMGGGAQTLQQLHSKPSVALQMGLMNLCCRAVGV